MRFQGLIEFGLLVDTSRRISIIGVNCRKSLIVKQKQHVRPPCGGRMVKILKRVRLTANCGRPTRFDLEVLAELGSCGQPSGAGQGDLAVGRQILKSARLPLRVRRLGDSNN